MAAPGRIELSLELEGHEPTIRQLNRQGERTQVKLEEIIDRYSFLIQRDAQINAPVDTGFLRSSIIVDEIEPLYNEVQVTAHYGHFVEFGTRLTPAQPFLVPAIQKHAPAYRQEVQRALWWGWMR